MDANLRKAALEYHE
ncbi:hypothetical protein LLE87_28090, partial [Paenibacillus polymyxa]|nr:hypothetical protein [Paenibacillus polymyxa]